MRVCVFCGSAPGRSPAYLEAARAFGAALAERGLGLVYGGASVGLMGAVADAALRAGGEVIGVLPEALTAREISHISLTRLETVPTMAVRKARMGELSDAFVALPGGQGTLDELFEVLTEVQIGLHHKPVGLLDVQGFYEPLVAALDHAAAEGFIRAQDRTHLRVESDPRALLTALQM